MSINILHLTDLHLDKNVIQDFEQMIRKPLIEDVNNCTGGKVDLLFITGDLVDKGGDDLGGLYLGLSEAKNKIIKTIINELNLSDESVFIVPGNHDIVRTADKDYIESGLKGKLKTNSDVNAFIKGTLGGDLDGVKRLSDYRKFEEEFYSDYSCKQTDTFFSSNFIKQIAGIKVGISCFNTAWRCYSNDDEGSLFIGDQEIHKSKNIVENCQVKVALLHHHINYLSKVERKVIENVLLKNYDLVFFGHSHKFDNYYKRRSDAGSVWVGSPSAFHNARVDSKEFSSGYSICKLSSSATNLEYRYFSYTNGDYRPNTEVGKNGFDKFRPIILLNESKKEEDGHRSTSESLTINLGKDLELDSEFIIAPEINFENKLKAIDKPSKLFTGRKDKLEELGIALEKNDIIVISGIGGIGKTELVLKYFSKFQKSSKERITLQNLSDKPDFDNYFVAAGFEEIIKNNKTETEKFRALVDKLNEFRRIIVWDNFHDIKDDIFHRFMEFSERKLKQSKIVIVSRTNEKLIRFKNIVLADFKEGKEFTNKLIEQRYGSLRLSEQEKSDICKYVKGHPLAIELALNLCCSLPAVKVLGKLSSHRKGIDDLSQRLFEDIINLESTAEEERAFLYQFSVFKGKASVEEVEAVFGASVFEVVPLLKEKHLIDFKLGFYETHPLIREFCYSRLGNKKELHSKVSDWLIGRRNEKLDTVLEERIFHHLKGAEKHGEVSRTVLNYGRELIIKALFNLLKDMIDFVEKHETFSPVFNILKGDICDVSGDWKEALLFYQKAKVADPKSEVGLEGLLKYGDIYKREGEVEKALSLFVESEQIAKSIDSKKFLAWSYNNIAIIRAMYGEIGEGFDLTKEALKISRNLGIKEDISALCINLGGIYSRPEFRGYDLRQSIKLYDESLAISIELEDQLGIAMAYHKLGIIYNDTEYKSCDWKKSEKFLSEGLRIRLEVGNKIGVATSYIQIGVSYLNKNFENYNLDLSFSNLNKGLNIANELGEKFLIGLSYSALGVVFGREEYGAYNIDTAISYLLHGLEISRALNDKSSVPICLWNIALAYEKKGNSENVLFYLLQCYACFRQIGNKATGAMYKYKSYGKTLEIATFKRETNNAYSKLKPEYQKEIEISDFLSEPRTAENKLGRNQKIKVKYPNGAIVLRKYKVLKKDIDSGKCKMVRE